MQRRTSLVVGEVADGCAVLTSDDLTVSRVPLALLPADARRGSVVTITASLDKQAETERDDAVRELQAGLLQRLGCAPPPPANAASAAADQGVPSHADEEAEDARQQAEWSALQLELQRQERAREEARGSLDGGQRVEC